jgi:lysophospholipase L1-like esterase
MRWVYAIIFIGSFWGLEAQTIEVSEPVRMLALGDSYTIGQSVDITERWPVQFLEKFEEQYGVTGSEVDIIARTGWTTGNLMDAIASQLDNSKKYTLVSLLIGVNNQYRGLNFSEYAVDFRELLQTALRIVNSDPNRVFVLSIPDYAYTPAFANNEEISTEIDAYNEVNRSITVSYGVPYVDITGISRRGLDEPDLVAADALHPSGKQYGEWVDAILSSVRLAESTVLTRNSGTDECSFFIQHGALHISGQHPGGTLRLLDLSGRILYVEEIGADTNAVGLPPLMPGTYIVRLDGAVPVVNKISYLR